jgi:nicotinate-nucleotide--dimethylbenzimidazole phosphoribosyltransferase
LTVLLDGYVASAAALIAVHQSPDAARSMIAAHQSAEPGHAGVLRALGLMPFLQWDLRLGEGTGALALLPLVDAAAAIAGQMATLESFGIQARGAP